MTLEPWTHNPARALGGRKRLSVADNYRYVAAQLRDRREQMGLSQKRLEEVLGVGHAQVGRWERAENVPGAAHLIRWAAELGCIVQIRRVG